MDTTRASDPAVFFELAAFAVSSARGALEEGVLTASLRLIDVAGRLAALAASYTDDPFLAELADRVAAAASAAYLDSPERYIAFLDDVLTDVALEGARRAGVEHA
jgi:hypothetical protein